MKLKLTVKAAGLLFMSSLSTLAMEFTDAEKDYVRTIHNNRRPNLTEEDLNKINETEKYWENFKKEEEERKAGKQNGLDEQNWFDKRLNEELIKRLNEDLTKKNEKKEDK